ncbi:SDR family oxidoreductase [Cronobacter turicensis]|uniref:SDR family oxidoreductase n=1 Tax=Cronobacter turicensis TaxID=413502 RepID=UPI001DE7AC03|nr:SDR family oxidoreductase [Cronobacter turicensis]EGT4491723.1 SDR family NAD(P)-dependent oxidoreductase [Cronobacter turicensis]EKM0436199.1 SDR family oxidoreductase [Cronobacter turicensis]ELY4322618.1 SDR family oxidoreductase [Cronobacter turicensis]ELY5943154.1 SDR family oxidoreductase [Cronobacter turicensis]ELY5963707.1 SDR family oxidoreductase [Cronobacter turicensis]
MSTALITGCSSGFGLATATLFLAKGWNVIATMRTPDPSLFPESDKLTLLPLDITSEESINEVVKKAGAIDLLVNNAGVGAPVPVELTPLATAQQLMNTNVLGTLLLTQAFLPLMREKKSGVIINVSSSVTTKAMPLIGVYRASKAALNAWSESLAIEARPFGIRVHVVLPGRSPETKFGENARAYFGGQDDRVYGEMVNEFIRQGGNADAPVTHADDVANAIYAVARDQNAPLYTAAGEDARQFLTQAQQHSPFAY